MVRASDFRWLPHEIIECERHYPGLLDDMFVQLGYREYTRKDKK